MMNAPVEYIPKKEWIDKIDTQDVLIKLIRLLKWEDHDTERKETFLKRKNVPYYYGGRRGFEVRPYYPQDEPLWLTTLWSLVEFVVKCDFEACFINYYLSDSGSIGWHSDDSPSIDAIRPVVILSFGAARTICFRSYAHPGIVENYVLCDGSIVVMKPGMQALWQHAVFPEKLLNSGGRRLSLVFRGLSGILAPE